MAHLVGGRRRFQCGNMETNSIAEENRSSAGVERSCQPAAATTQRLPASGGKRMQGGSRETFFATWSACSSQGKQVKGFP